nr:MAG TPA: hypothetical protein [Caudoviricetes sp.]
MRIIKQNGLVNVYVQMEYGLTLVHQHYGLIGVNKVYQVATINIDGKYLLLNLLFQQIQLLQVGLLIVR